VLRHVAALLAGILGGGLVIAAIQAVSNALYPPPPALDLQDAAALAEWITKPPLGALALVLLSYVVGSLFGGAVATMVSRERAPALIVGFVLMLLGFVNLWTIQHALWFAVISTLVYLPFAYLGSRMVRWTIPK